jgi:hypothetical protein
MPNKGNIVNKDILYFFSRKERQAAKNRKGGIDIFNPSLRPLRLCVSA